ncbi:MAG: MFS transporter [Salinarimonadaceae bacterium]|nr:MAG: MFS transporter [Salinarimonadaceae bacterium]
MPPPPADAHSVRLVIIILSIAGFASTYAGRAVDPMVNDIALDLAAPAATIALLSTAFALPYALVQPILGPVGDALGKIRVMRFCLAMLFLALAGSAFMPDEKSLFFMRALSGVAAGGVIPLALAMIGDRVALEGRQVALSRFLMAVILGQLAGASLSGAMTDLVGWRAVLLFTAAVAGAAFFAATFSLRGGVEPTAPFSLATAITRYRALLANPRGRALFSLVFVEAIATLAVIPFVAPILASREAGGALEAGLALTGFAVGGLLYTGFVRIFVRRLGLYGMVIIGGISSAAALVTIALALDWRIMAVGLLLLGFGFYMMHNTFQVQVTELSPEARGSAVALHACSYFFGVAVGPVIFKYASLAFGEIATLVFFALLITCLGVFAAWILARTTSPQPRAR